MDRLDGNFMIWNVVIFRDVTIYENEFPFVFSCPIVAPNFDKLEDDLLYEYIVMHDDGIGKFFHQRCHLS